MDSLHGFLLFLDSLDFVALDCFLGFYSSRNLFIHGILFRGISLFLAMPFIESLDFVALDCFLGLRLRKLLLIHCHGLISWIHSIHDFGSFSVGSEIFLFRIYVLLMSWHTSRILFYCYGFMALAWLIESRIYSSFFSWFDLLKLEFILHSFLGSIY